MLFFIMIVNMIVIMVLMITVHYYNQVVVGVVGDIGVIVL